MASPSKNVSLYKDSGVLIWVQGVLIWVRGVLIWTMRIYILDSILIRWDFCSTYPLTCLTALGAGKRGIG